MSYLFPGFIAFLILTVSSCNTQSGSSSDDPADPVINKVIKLAPYKKPCLGVARFMCMIVVLEDGSEEFFYDGIKGFEFEWGYRYSLAVTVRKIKNPPADGSDRSYELRSVVEKERSPESFTVRLNPEWLEKEDSKWFLLGEEFVCGDEELCTEIENLLGGPGPFTDFSYEAAFDMRGDMSLVLTGFHELKFGGCQYLSFIRVDPIENPDGDRTGTIGLQCIMGRSLDDNTLVEYEKAWCEGMKNPIDPENRYLKFMDKGCDTETAIAVCEMNSGEYMTSLWLYKTEDIVPDEEIFEAVCLSYPGRHTKLIPPPIDP